MKAFVLLILLIVGLVPASAKPGDRITVRGILAWPQVLGNEPFIVVQADDGRVYYVDVTVAPRHPSTTLRAGERVSFTGLEGARPYETTAMALGSDDTALTPGSPTGTGVAASPRMESRVPPVAGGASPHERIHGTVRSVSGHTLVLQRDDGRTVDVDVSRLDGRIARDVEPGQQITVFGTTEPGRPLTAVGFIITDPRSTPSRPTP